MKIWLIADTHFNHFDGEVMKTYCKRPPNYQELIIKNWKDRVKPWDTLLHLGDVGVGNKIKVAEIVKELPGTKILVQGNHDDEKSCSWWMDHGFDFACEGLLLRGQWFTHKPTAPPLVCAINQTLNIHGHLHNIWDGFHGKDIPTPTKLEFEWQRLFAVEYTNYCPIEFQDFLYHPDKYQARGPKHA